MASRASVSGWVRQNWVPLACIAWGCALVFGFSLMWRYKSAPGAASQAIETWPAQSKLILDPHRATLLMFVHPHCPCSEASLSELEKIVQRGGQKLRTEVVVVHPQGTPAGWETGGLGAHARRIASVSVIEDVDGVEMRLFGAKTSGACLLYDPHGMLMFSGGITAIRGHEGDNLGEQRIVALVKGEQTDRRDSPVFGCALEGVHAQGGETHGR